MRHETQRDNSVRAAVEIQSAGAGLVGLVPVVSVQRIDTGEYLNVGATLWAVGAATNLMAPVDAVAQPGLYAFNVPVPLLTAVSVGGDIGLGFFLKISEPTQPLLEYVKVEIEEEIAGKVWDEALSGHLGAGSAGRALQLTVGLVQGNHRLKDPTYDPDGRLLTAKLVVYPTGPNAIAETSDIATFNVTCTYDGDGNLETLLSAE